jgi:hypothetical protein
MLRCTTCSVFLKIYKLKFSWFRAVGMRLAVVWKVRQSNPYVGDIFTTSPNLYFAPQTAPCEISTEFIWQMKHPGSGIDHLPHLGPRFKEGLSYEFTTTVVLHGLSYIVYNQ